MKTIKPVISIFMALVLALFFTAIPAQASGLANGGYHDDGVGPDGNHYYEIYWYSGDSHVQCLPYQGSDGYITVQFSSANQISGGGWVPVYDVFQYAAGVSGFSQRECQVNVYARNGTGLRQMLFSWTLNGNAQPGNQYFALTF